MAQFPASFLGFFSLFLYEDRRWQPWIHKSGSFWMRRDKGTQIHSIFEYIINLILSGSYVTSIHPDCFFWDLCVGLRFRFSTRDFAKHPHTFLTFTLRPSPRNHCERGVHTKHRKSPRLGGVSPPGDFERLARRRQQVWGFPSCRRSPRRNQERRRI